MPRIQGLESGPLGSLAYHRHEWTSPFVPRLNFLFIHSTRHYLFQAEAEIKSREEVNS